MNCDNEGWVYLSKDEGRSWEEMDHLAHWPTTVVVDIPDVTDRTVVRVDCKDHGGIGGFIASMEFPVGKEVYSTTNVLEEGNWRVTASTDGFTFGLIYREKGGWPWYLKDTSSVDPAAWWVWNGKTMNTMTFEFDFGSLDGTKMNETHSLFVVRKMEDAMACHKVICSLKIFLICHCEHFLVFHFEASEHDLA